jgi:hypothetical protein
VLCRFIVNDQPNCDQDEAINAGSIIQVNTRRHDMTDNGAQLIGRFPREDLREIRILVGEQHGAHGTINLAMTPRGAFA